MEAREKHPKKWDPLLPERIAVDSRRPGRLIPHTGGALGWLYAVERNRAECVKEVLNRFSIHLPRSSCGLGLKPVDQFVRHAEPGLPQLGLGLLVLLSVLQHMVYEGEHLTELQFPRLCATQLGWLDLFCRLIHHHTRSIHNEAVITGLYHCSDFAIRIWMFSIIVFLLRIRSRE